MSPTIESTYRALLLNVMVVMMEEDGILEDREVALIGDVFEELVGFRLSDRIRSRLLDSVQESRDQVLDQVLERASILSTEQRRSIFEAALRVLRADGAARSREYRFLMDLGVAVGLSQSEIDELV